MKREDRERILAAIARLKAGHLELRASAAEELLMEVLTPLLTEDGYDVRMTRTTRKWGTGLFGQTTGFRGPSKPDARHRIQILPIRAACLRRGS